MQSFFLLITILTGSFLSYYTAAEIEVTPALQAEIALYIISQEKKISLNDDNLVLAVIGNEHKDIFFTQIFLELEKKCLEKQKKKGCTIKKHLYPEVEKIDEFLRVIKKEKINAFYLSSIENESTLTKLGQESSSVGIISIARKMDWVQKGLSYGIFMKDGRLRLYINSTNIKNGNFILPPEILRFSEFFR